MRARQIKRGFYTDEDLAERSVWARLLFPALWQMADREGRLEDRPALIRVAAFPYDNLEGIGVSVNDLLSELAAPRRHSPEGGGFIYRYEVDGRRYIQIRNFRKHQNPHPNEPASQLPVKPQCHEPSLSPPDIGASPNTNVASARAVSSVPSVPSIPSGTTDPPQTTAALPDDPTSAPGTVTAAESVALAKAHVLAVPSWNREAAELWWLEYKGDPPKQFFGALKALVKRETWERVRPALVTYMAETPAEFVNIAGKFVAAFGTWEARARGGQRAPPKVSEKARAKDDGDLAMIRAGLKGGGGDGRGVDQGHGRVAVLAGPGRLAGAEGDPGDGVPARAERSQR